MDTKVISTRVRYSTIPESYVRPVSERPNLSQVADCQNVPIIDLGFEDRCQIIQQIGYACREYGFFQVVNHGVDMEIVEKMQEVANEFFHLPLEEKLKLYSDDPSKTMRLSTSFNVKKETVHNWRDYLRLHCYPLAKICQHYCMLGNCVQGDKRKDLHSSFCGNGFSMLAKLEGHNKAVTGIAFCSDKLYSGSSDKSLRIWDWYTGQCVGVVKFDGGVGSLISEGSRLFVGLPYTVKAWNFDTHKELTLKQPVGEVYAMVVGNEMFFAGTQDGTIFVYKSSSETEPAASMKGHSGSVVSLVVGANRLYSGSLDQTIRVWDLDTLQCIQTLNGHKDDVTSVLCWNNFLLSCSLDRTIKVWAASEGGNLEVYTHNVECGAIALCGILDAEAKPILLCSCNDNSVRLYDLPSFYERGRIFAKKEVRAIQIGPGGHFFTGDATGELRVWKLSGESIPVVG